MLEEYKQKYRILFTRYIAQKLDLLSIENKIEAAGIKSLGRENKELKYFELANEIQDPDVLSEDLKKTFYRYMAMEIEQLIAAELEGEVESFILRTHRLMLFPQGDEKYYYCGAIIPDNLVPRDSIVLAIVREDLDSSPTFTEESYYDKLNLLVDIANEIQEKTGPRAGFKVAVVFRNEFSYDKSVLL